MSTAGRQITLEKKEELNMKTAKAAPVDVIRAIQILQGACMSHSSATLSTIDDSENLRTIVTQQHYHLTHHDYLTNRIIQVFITLTGE